MLDAKLISLQAMTTQLPVLAALQQTALQPPVVDDRPAEAGPSDPARGQVLDIRA